MEKQLDLGGKKLSWDEVQGREICRVAIYFDRGYDNCNDSEKQKLFNALKIWCEKFHQVFSCMANGVLNNSNNNVPAPDATLRKILNSL